MAPNNVYIYLAAFTGAMSGIVSPLIADEQGSTESEAYSGARRVAMAFAQEVDKQWKTIMSSKYDEDLLSDLASKVMERKRDGFNEDDAYPQTWTEKVSQIIAVITATRPHVDEVQGTIDSTSSHEE